MKLIDKVLTGVAVTLLFLGIASIESTPILLPLLMILGGGAWLVYAANAFKWE
jgi:hypothetical protein